MSKKTPSPFTYSIAIFPHQKVTKVGFLGIISFATNGFAPRELLKLLMKFTLNTAQGSLIMPDMADVNINECDVKNNMKMQSNFLS